MNLIKKLKSFNLTLSINYIVGLIYTKLFFKKSKLIRRPFYLRNEGKFLYGEGLSLGPNTVIEVFGEKSLLEIGTNFSSYYNLHIGCCDHIFIGNNVLVASNVYISDHQHGFYKNSQDSDITSPYLEPLKRKIHSESVFIGDNVWIGEGAKILSGVKIGNGCIIGAASVVTKDIPKNTICAGSPAIPIKFYNEIEKKWTNA